MSDEFDGSMTLRSPGLEPIRQFVTYAENKVGWLNDFLLMLDEGDIHILAISVLAVSYTHLRAHETREDLVCRLLLEKKKK